MLFLVSTYFSNDGSFVISFLGDPAYWRRWFGSGIVYQLKYSRILSYSESLTCHSMLPTAIVSKIISTDNDYLVDASVQAFTCARLAPLSVLVVQTQDVCSRDEVKTGRCRSLWSLPGSVGTPLLSCLQIATVYHMPRSPKKSTYMGRIRLIVKCWLTTGKILYCSWEPLVPFLSLGRLFLTDS